MTQFLGGIRCTHDSPLLLLTLVSQPKMLFHHTPTTINTLLPPINDSQ